MDSKYGLHKSSIISVALFWVLFLKYISAKFINPLTIGGFEGQTKIGKFIITDTDDLIFVG